MHGAILSVTIASVLAFPAVFATVTNIAAQNGETLRNVWLTEAGPLVLGSNRSLRRLSAADLSVVEEVSLPEGQVSRLLVGDPGGTYSGRVLSCLRTDCSLLDVNDIASHNWEVSNVLLVDGMTNAGGLFVRGREDTSVLTVGLQRNGEQVSRIVRGNLVNVGETSGQGFSIFARQTEGFIYDREFLTIFQNDGFSYFVTKQGPDDETRVVRVCNNDTSSEIADGGFASYFEIRLECGGSGSVPTAAAFLPSDQTITLSAAQSQNLVCVFKLFDIHQLMTQKYDDCRHGMGSTGLARSGTKICEDFGDRLSNSDITECNLVSSLLPFQEVENPLSAGPIFSLPLSNGNFTSLIHSTLDNVRYLFAGTHNGTIYQYHYVSSTSINPIRTINLVSSEEMSGTNVTQLTVASDGLTLYALSPSKLYSITIDACDTYHSCDACLGESGDPICGWCSLENRCSRQSECSAVWVSDSIGSCPVITSADPSIIYVKELQMEEVDIQLTTANIPEGVSYECRYGFQGGTSEQVSTTSTVTMVIPATRNNDMFTCRVRYNDVPKIPTNKDSLQSMLSLRYQENDVAVLDSPVRFANCSVHTNCTSCISSESQCNWCPFTFKCIAPRNDSCSGVDETVMESCPKLLPPLDNDNYVIHVDYTYGETPLVIRAENLGQFSDSFSSKRFNCVMKNGAEVLFRTDAVLNADGNVECVETRFDYTLSDGMTSLEARLAVEWFDNDVSIDNPVRTGVTLYTCGGLGTNCAQCLAIPSIFDCEYCKSTSPLSCVLSDRCNDVIDDLGDCELPEIMSVSPSSGPTEGGTVVTVRGTNLAVTRSQIRNVTIAGAECVIIDNSYQPGIEFQCVTGRSVGGRGSYQVEIEFAYLTMIRRGSAFTYEEPRLTGVDPAFGPKSGGIEIVISGGSLSIGNTENTTVKLGDSDCAITYINDSRIICKSGGFQGNNVFESSVVVNISNARVSDDRVRFDFREDPVFMSVSPQRIIPAGGIDLTFIGMNFDVVVEPVFVYTDARLSNAVGVGGCDGTEGSTMICSLPRFTSQPPDLTNISYTVRFGNAPGPNRTRAELTLESRPDPVFPEDGTALSQTEFSPGSGAPLTISGMFLNSVDRSEIHVTVGGEECEAIITEDQADAYTCLVPGDPPNGVNDANIIVMVGQNLRYEIGTVTYKRNEGEPSPTEEGASSTGAIVGSVISGLVVLSGAIILILVLFVVFKRIKTSANETLVANRFAHHEMVETKGVFPSSEGGEGAAMERAREELKKLIPQRLHIPGSQLRLLDSVGHGEFGEVYKAWLIGLKKQRAVAVKTLRGLFSANDVQQILQEVVKMKDFKHRHVMPLIGVCLDSGVGVVMPFMANGSILNYLKKERGTLLLNEDAEMEQIVPVRKLLMRMCLEIAKGMEYLAEQKFVHRDLAARNCMLDHSGCVKVGDFGLAEDIYSTGYVREDNKTVKIPYKWMPPESLEDALFSELSDVWSYGVTCWEIFTVGKTPYPALDPPTLLRMLKEGHRLEYPDNTACSPEMYSVMKRCWKLAPDERLRFSDLVVRVDKTLQSVAGYVELSMTLEKLDPGEEEEEDWTGYEVMEPGLYEAAEEEILVDPNPSYGTKVVIK